MATKKTPTKMLLRVPPELRSRIERGAQESSRSLNREICHQLRLSYSLQDIKRQRAA